MYTISVNMQTHDKHAESQTTTQLAITKSLNVTAAPNMSDQPTGAMTEPKKQKMSS